MSDDSTTERHVDLDIGRIRVRESGDGPPVLLAHGALVNSHLWDDVIPLLADRHRVIAPDLPLGCHADPVRRAAPLDLPAQADVVADLVTALHLDDVTLIAWSADDRIFPPEHASRLAALLPHATVPAIADSLAFSPIDQPSALAQRIAEFTDQAA